MSTEEECPGEGKCHGCLKFCNTCGDVGHVCDTRLRDERCDEHPVPPSAQVLREARLDAERRLHQGKEMVRAASTDLTDTVELEHARREYDRQTNERDRRAIS